MIPTLRPRRLRLTANLRALVQETHLSVNDFVLPLFVTSGKNIRKPISSMPGHFQLSLDFLTDEIAEINALGLKSVLLFGIPAQKDALGSENFSDEGIIQQAVRHIKSIAPELVVITDVCMCEYTDHGHCGLLNHEHQPHLPQDYVLNDETLAILAKVAISHAQAGADIIAPSGMIDGMVAHIRHALDEAQFAHLPILSYAVKYASSFYGPFREAAEGTPQFGDRKTHQMNPANVHEALKEVDLDVHEGADMLMVKPALAYLDVIRVLKDRYPQYPMVAYNVSGEYAMIKAAAQNGWLDEQKTTLEVLTSIKRAGADIIITYHAKEAIKWMNHQ